MSAEQKEELIRQPRLLLESFNLSEKALNAGDQADMELVFKNRSSSQGIYNLKVSFSTESPSIQFEKKSFYFSGVNPGADINRRITAAQILLVLKKVGLDPDLKKAVAKYSLGMRQRLGIAQAIMEDPDLLILDEPFNGLDKHGVEEIRKILLELKKEGKSILLASHNAEDIRILCDRVFEMDGGILRERGTAE